MAQMRRVSCAGWDIHAYDVLTSTNDEAAHLGRSGDDEGVAVWAEIQTAGRGRRGREWRSETGNLFVSLLFRPRVALARAAELSFVAAVSVADALAALLPVGATSPSLKWPNDILLGDGKLAGILLESESGADGNVAWVVVGVGINLSSAPVGIDRPAVKLPEIVSPGAALEALLIAVNARYAQWNDQGFEPIRKAWLEKAVGVGKPIVARLANETVAGAFHGLDSDGVLLLDVGQGASLRRISAGEVFFGEEA